MIIQLSGSFNAFRGGSYDFVVAGTILVEQQQKGALGGQMVQDSSSLKYKKLDGISVSKYEVSEDKVKFFVIKGFFKKRFVLVKEVPVKDITAVEYLGNWISLTCNDASFQFVLKKKKESFAELNGQIQGLLEDNQKGTVQKNELKTVIECSLPIIDASFDILMGLHAKRVDWTRIEGYTEVLNEPFSFESNFLSPLRLDFKGIIESIKTEVPKKVAGETFAVLKAVYGYFVGLELKGELADNVPKIVFVKSLISAYYVLNDLFFARIVGEKDSKKEVLFMEENLKTLGEKSGVDFDSGSLVGFVDGLNVEADNDNIGETRELFKAKIYNFFS